MTGPDPAAGTPTEPLRRRLIASVACIGRMADAHAAQQFRLGLAQQRQRDQNRELISRRSHVLPVAALRRVAGLRSLQDAVGSDRPLFGKDSAYLAPRGSRLTVAQAGGWAEPAGAA